MSISIGDFTPPDNTRNELAATAPLEGGENIISAIIGVLTVLAGIFMIFYFITGALGWITAGGDQGKITKARDQMMQGVIGLIIIVAAYGIIGLIGRIIGIDLLNPQNALCALVPGESC